MASRQIEELLPELQEIYAKFKEKMAEAGISYIVTCTYRSPEEQKILYAQGRSKPGKKVTWTLHSKHIDRKAFDIAIMKDGRITWDAKDYEGAAKIGQECGLIAGYFWTKQDAPHFEIK